MELEKSFFIATKTKTHRNKYNTLCLRPICKRGIPYMHLMNYYYTFVTPRLIYKHTVKSVKIPLASCEGGITNW